MGIWNRRSLGGILGSVMLLPGGTVWAQNAPVVPGSRFPKGIFQQTQPVPQPAEAIAPTSLEIPPKPTLPMPIPYLLGPGDRLKLSFPTVPEYDGEQTVTVNGLMSLPLLGTVSVNNLSLEAFSQQLGQVYRPYLRQPVVVVSLVQARPVRLTLAGEVARPGTYTLPVVGGQLPTFSDALKVAGGLRSTADLQNLTIDRTLAGQRQTLLVDLSGFTRGNPQVQDLMLRDGDHLTVGMRSDGRGDPVVAQLNFGLQGDQKMTVAVTGEVIRPGSYPLSGAGPLRLSQALQAAGGIQPWADVRSITLTRRGGDGQDRTFTADLWTFIKTGDLTQDPLLQEGDRIAVARVKERNPQEAATLAQANISPATMAIQVLGEVVRPGAVNVAPNTPLNQAILAAGGLNVPRANPETVILIRLNGDGSVSKQAIALDFASAAGSPPNPLLLAGDVVVVQRSGMAIWGDGLHTLLSPIGDIFPVLGLFDLITR